MCRRPAEGTDTVRSLAPSAAARGTAVSVSFLSAGAAAAWRGHRAARASRSGEEGTAGPGAAAWGTGCPFLAQAYVM